DALKYPYQALEKVIILGAVPLVALIIFVIVMLALAFTGSDVALVIGLVIGTMLLILSGFFVAGYLLRVVQTSLAGEDEMPDFSNRWELLGNGLKLVVVQIVYLLIPFLAIILGLWISYSASAQALLGFLLLTMILGFLLFILFSLFMIMATAHLAATDSLKAAFQFSLIQQKISNVGWGTYFLWYLMMLVLGMVGVVVMAFLSVIPILGSIVGWILIQPYLQTLFARSLALVYLAEMEGDV
ncbi:MAG: DUF4013 domain-containing protein, partial [Methanobacteriaceae archaeon]|nr:DUF4013 domain-containing protein [Methanobacteriaceae archaeon]